MLGELQLAAGTVRGKSQQVLAGKRQSGREFFWKSQMLISFSHRALEVEGA